MSQPLDPQRPPWQFHFVPEYEGGCAVIGRFHHCIGDGLAMMYVLLTMTDTPPAPGPGEDGETPPEKRRARPVLDFVTNSLSPVVSFTRNLEEGVVREVREMVARPARALDVTRDLSVGAGALGKLLVMSSDPRTPFKGPLSSAKRAVWAKPVPIQAIKEIARVSGSKINDVVLAAVAGGMRRYLIAHGHSVVMARALRGGGLYAQRKCANIRRIHGQQGPVARRSATQPNH